MKPATKPGAENGVLTVMVGGDEADFNVVQPVMAAFSRLANY